MHANIMDCWFGKNTWSASLNSFWKMLLNSTEVLWLRHWLLKKLMRLMLFGHCWNWRHGAQASLLVMLTKFGTWPNKSVMVLTLAIVSLIMSPKVVSFGAHFRELDTFIDAQEEQMVVHQHYKHQWHRNTEPADGLLNLRDCLWWSPDRWSWLWRKSQVDNQPTVRTEECSACAVWRDCSNKTRREG